MNVQKWSPPTVIAKVEAPSGYSLTSEPQFFYGNVDWAPNSMIVHAVTSTIVRGDDPVFSEVAALVLASCYTVLLNRVIPDQEMWFGESRVSMIEIHDSCPSTEHQCLYSMLRRPIGEVLGMRGSFG